MQAKDAMPKNALRKCVFRRRVATPARPTRASQGMNMTSATVVRISATTKNGSSVAICLMSTNIAVSSVTASSIQRMPRKLSSFGR